MRIGPFGHWEILIILLIVLLLFGANRLPGMAKSIGQSVREFRRGIRDDDDDSTPSTAAGPDRQRSNADAAERR